MRSNAEPRPAASRARVLELLRERLDSAEQLSGEVREALRIGDAESIETATRRLETLVLEFKLLAEEHERLPGGDPDPSPPEHLERARADLEQACARIARTAAVGSGLLERLVILSRGLIASLNADAGDAYLPSGTTRERSYDGVRLKETV